MGESFVNAAPIARQIAPSASTDGPERPSRGQVRAWGFLLVLASIGIAVYAQPPAPAVSPAPQPTAPPPDWQAILAGITERAINYTNNLPNYICSEVTRRHVDPQGNNNWRLMDTIQEQLTFFEHHEQYKVMMINGAMQNHAEHEKLGGSISSGEFGTMLSAIFRPETETEFQWHHLGKFDGRVVYEFTYHVSKPIYSIYHDGTQRTVHVGYHGMINADRDTKMVTRIQMETEGIPADFPVQEVTLDLRYDFTLIGEQQYVVPHTLEMRSRDGTTRVWNEAEFRLYRKYGTESKIVFDDGAAKEDKPPAKKP